ncbi:MAG TPA: polynucleotide adenylyltransferase [Verrucomicrobiales bacterium]|nr:polynucleotide adenylyltransferase [Verrucomicrobiales bacterium]
MSCPRAGRALSPGRSRTAILDRTRATRRLAFARARIESPPVELPDQLRRLLRDVPELARAYLVGGCVRDALLGMPNKDFDLEVFGVSFEALQEALRPHGRVDLVGRAFGVVKFRSANGDQWDFSIPRRDSKTGVGHTGFAVTFDPDITPQEAARRRDFTINAILYDPRRDEHLDFFGGRDDLRNRVLRHTGPAFTEDPLRVLRGMQFASRMELQPARETVELCRSISSTFGELPRERVGDEWLKWAAKSRRPSIGLQFLRDCDWLKHFPELAALDGTPQDPEWHPEGDVFIHTCHCCDALATLDGWLAADDETKCALMLAVLTHDLAKPQTTHEAERDGRLRIVSPGHEEQSGPLAEAFLSRINAPKAIRERVVPLVTNHLAHLQTQSDRSVRRLANRLRPATIDELCLVMTADQFGRPPKPREVHAGVRDLLKRAEALRLQDQAPRPILLGRHLIGRGMKPGKEFGRLLAAGFEAQLEGAFHDVAGAERWLDEQLGQ